MTQAFSKFTICALLLCTIFSATAAETDHLVEKRKFNLPPSADLNYAITAQKTGLQLNGDAIWKWSASSSKYKIDTQTRAQLLGKILEAKSEGNIDDYGLAPVTATEKHFHKDATTTSFNRDSKLISFNGAAETSPIKDGEQDRNSAIWELIAVARGEHGKFKENSEWDFLVAGQHDAEQWLFKVGKTESIHTRLGNMNGVHVIRMLADNNKGQQVDIWLAPSMEWYPVRLRFTEQNGDYIEQVLDSVAKSSD